MDGQVASTVIYDEFVRRRPRKFAEKVLGMAEAEAVLDGLRDKKTGKIVMVTLDKFVTDDLKTLSLKEVAEAEGLVLR